MIDEPAQVKRTAEIEEGTNRYFIHPLSRRFVAFFARWNLSPNAVSLLGMALGAAAAAAYYHYSHWPMALLGFLAMIGWHVMDGADGQLARLTERTSELGEVLDGLCDHVAFTLVYVSLALATAPTRGAWVWGVAAVAGLCHIAQASAYEFQRQAYDFWVHADDDARLTPLDDFRQTLQGRRGLARLFGRLHLFYLKIQYRVAAFDASLHARLTTALRKADDETRFRAAYRATHLSGVRRWALLCSNYRTLAIFLACLAGDPLFFFWFEIVVLNVAFVLLVRMTRRHHRALHTRLDELEARTTAPFERNGTAGVEHDPTSRPWSP